LPPLPETEPDVLPCSLHVVYLSQHPHMEIENPWALIIGSVAILGILYWRLGDLIFFSFRAVKTKGKIVNWMRRTEKGKELFYPLIEFQLQNGIAHQFRAGEYSEGSPMYARGTEVQIRYIPGKMNDIRTTYPSKK